MTDNKRKRRRSAPRASSSLPKINVAVIIAALEEHVLGIKEMSASQVSAALALLKKALPDIAEVKKPVTDQPSQTHEDALGALE